ncbi:MAG: extracellular solute-binding protein [Candidatus Micrarchaeaceae archaeon]
MRSKGFLVLLIVSLLFVSYVMAKTTITFFGQWADYEIAGITNAEGQVIYPGFQYYINEYMKLHPDVEIKVRMVPFNEYLQDILVSHTSGNAADIYEVYTLWVPQLVNAGVLAEAPTDIASAVEKDFIPQAVGAITVNKKIYGIPSEYADYALIYNKKLFAAAGYTEPPKTWNDLVTMAKHLTKYDPNGAISQYGFAFLTGWVSGIVHPYLSLLYSLGGSMFNDNNTKCLLNKELGVEALNAELALFKEGATNSSGNFSTYFPQNKVAMSIEAPWAVDTLRLAYGDEYDEYVGIAPIPPLGNKYASCAYSWAFAVDNASKNKTAAWNFLKWFAIQLQSKTKTTRAGDLETDVIYTIPPNKYDIENQPILNSQLKVYVDQLENSVTEPIVMQGAQIETILMNEIMAAWNNQKTAQQALDDAVAKIDPILAQYYK